MHGGGERSHRRLLLASLRHRAILGTQGTGRYPLAPLCRASRGSGCRTGRQPIALSLDAPIVPASFRLDGRVALVTGAGRGLGAVASLALAQAGAEVLLLSRTLSELEEIQKDIIKAGGRAKVLVCDVTDSNQFGSELDRLERLDILVNNAGMNIPEPFVQVSESHLDEMLALNVRAAFLVAQIAVRKMLEAGPAS